VDDDVALLDRGRTEHGLEVGQHVVDEVGRLALARGQLDVDLLLDVFLGRLVCLRLAQRVDRDHAAEHALGAWIMPARKADWAAVRSFASLLKYVRAAAPTP
jgi:hypothetical protein